MKNLTRFLYVLGLVPIVAGGATVLFGADSVPSPGEPSANLESELRFYAVWYIGAGLALWWLAPRIADHAREFRVFCGLLFLTGCSRILAALNTDWPSTGQMALLVVELTLPVVLVTWQDRAARQS